MKALDLKEFGDYWFESGTPTFLVELMKKHQMSLRNLDNTRRTADQLSKIDNFNNDVVPLLFQSGYLTMYKVGVSFSSKTRRVSEWKMES